MRFFQGKDGIRQVYEDMLRTRQTIYFLATNADHEVMSIDFYKRFHKERTKEPQDYTAPVEIAVYDDKVSHISFGEEVMATIIESPQIAQAMSQIMGLLEKRFAA